MVAIENSLEHLNDESLFGSLKTDQNLIEEGNIALGTDLDNSANNHEDEIERDDHRRADRWRCNAPVVGSPGLGSGWLG